MQRAFLATALLSVSSVLISGCAVRPVYMVGPPPPPPVEYYGVAPGPGYIWTPGFYARAGGGYRWHRGYWRHGSRR